MRKNNKLIVIISIVLVLAVAGATLAYLYLATDTFKSKEELFSKYIQQNSDAFQKVLNLEIAKVYGNLEEQNKLESKTNIKMSHSEGGEISNPLNNLTAKLNVQKNDDEQYLYADGQILYENEEYLETEIIKEQDVYGIRFSDAVKQFVTIKNDENIETVAKDIGIESEQLKLFMEDGEKNFSKEQIIALKDKYLNIIIEEIKKGTFQKQKNAMITYNDATVETNAYSVMLTSEQVENLLIQLLDKMKNETEILDSLNIIVDKETIIKQIDLIMEQIKEEIEIPTIKITVYEQKQKTIRTIIEVGVDKITIENIESNEGVKTKINYSNFSSEQSKEYKIEINKQNLENQENIEININVIEGEENYTITVSSKMQQADNKVEYDLEINHKEGIITKSFIVENEVNIGNSFEKMQTLKQGNNILMNSLNQEKRIELMDLLKKIVPQKINERLDLLKQKFGISDSDNEMVNGEEETQITQVEINKFNSKFEFYTGDEVSTENVKTLLDIVKNNLASYEITDIESQEDSGNIGIEEAKCNIKLIIEKDVTNEEGINKVLEKIEDNQKYKISIFYKNENGLIDYITITEI